MKTILLYPTIISMLAAVAQAQNETVAWQTPANISGASDVSKLGTYFGSWAPYDGNANSLPVNGVKFQGSSDLPGMNVNFPNDDQSGYNGFKNPGTLNSNYNTLLQTATYCGSSGGTIVITWSDIPGHTYLIEVWANDGRGLFPGRTETVTGGNNTSANLDFGDAPGQYVIGTYVADSSGSETITLSGANSTNGDYPQVNLLLIRDITEANITWQAPANISGASDVNTQGTYFGSWAPDASSPLTVNGVTFQNNSDLPGFSTTGFNASYNGFPNPGTANNNYNTLLESGAYEYPGPACTLSWAGMTPGHTYLVQFWVNGNDSSRTETLTGGANTSAAIIYEPGQYITGTFLATNSQETITLNGNPSDNYPQVNLVQIRDLTAPAAFTNYQSSVLADDPLGYWPLDLTDTNAANGIATDLSGNGNDGYYYDITPSGNLVAGPSRYIANAASFNSAEVDLGSGADPMLLDFGGPMTMEAWVQATSPMEGTNPPADILAKGYDANNNYDEIALRANGGNYYGGTYNGSDNGANAQGGQETASWTYVVSTYDGTNWNMYVNGQLVGQAADTVGAIEWQAPWAIGNGTLNGDGRYFQGNICQVALYNYALTPGQIITHYYEAELNASPATSVPIILSQPQPQPGFIGGSATFSVSVLSALPATNQWFEGNTPLAGQTNLTLTLTNLQLGEAGSYSVLVGNANGTTNSVAAALTVVSPVTLEWGTNENSGIWDVTNSANWINLSNDTQTVFAQGDAVLFNDTVGEPTNVTVNGTVDSSLITVNASTNNFSISSGTISGAGSLLKEGTSLLTITSAGNFTGSATIGGGALYAGNNCLSDVSSITVSNNSTLDFGGGQFSAIKPITVSGSGFSGEGALFNSYNDDPQELLNITMTGNAKFGASQRWDMASGSEISGPHNLTVDWSAGAGYGQWNGVTIGANVPEITVTNASPLGMTAMDTSCQSPSTLFNISTNGQLVLYSGGFNGSVSLYNGAQMIVYSANVNLAGSTLHLYSGATMYLYAQGIAMTGNNLIFENGASLQTFYNSGVNPINNQVTLNGVAHFVLGDHNEDFSNVISGPGGFVLDYYNQSVVLSATNTYSGPTVIGSDGNTPDVALTGNGSISQSSLIFFGGSNPDVMHIDVSGRTDDTFTLAGGQTLAGVGGINGNLVVSSGATVSPSGTNITIGIDTTSTNAVGAIAASGSVTLGGSTILKLDGSGSNDMVQAGGNMVYGGTLNLVNISGSPLAAGNSFQIFNAANYSGSFINITPSTPGSGLEWDTSNLAVNGTLTVVSMPSQPRITSVALSGTTLTITASNGPVNTAYVLLESTNAASALTNWIPVLTNSFNGSGEINLSTNVINSNSHQEFYILQTQ